MSKCLNAPILIAVPIREAIPVVDRALGLQDQAVLVLGDHLALVRVDQVVLVMMIARHVGMTGVRLVTVRLVAILVIGLRVGMIGVLMIGPHVATEQIPAQAVLGLGDHLARVRVDLVVLVMMIVRLVGILVIGLLVVMIAVVLVIVLLVVILVIVRRVAMIAVVRMIVLRVVILAIGRRVAMIGVLMIGLRVVILVTVRLVVTSVTVRLVGMIGVQMIGLLVGTVLAPVGRLVRDVMTVVMVGDVVVPVKKTLLPGSRVMRPSAGVQQFVPEVVVPFVRI